MDNPSVISKLVQKYGAEVRSKLQDPIFFIEEIIGLKLTPYQKEWLELIEKNDKVAITAFRSSGKSEVLNICYPIFRAFTKKKGEKFECLVISASQPQSSEILKRIKTKIMENEVLRSAIPSDKSYSWSNTQIQLKNGARIISRSITSNIVGYHVELIVCDEIGYYRDHSVFETAIPPMVTAHDGKIMCIGTPTSFTDLLHKLAKNEAYVSIVYPVITKERDLWNERYPDKNMKEYKKQYDSVTWSREYMCRPISSEDQMFPFELIERAYDYAVPFTVIYDKRYTYFIGMDFALSAEAGADYTVFTVIQKNTATHELRVVHIERHKGLSYLSQKKRIYQLYITFKPIKILVDEGTFGKSFMQDMKMMNIPVEGYRFNNESKQDLIMSLRNVFENDKLRINFLRSDHNTDEMVRELTKELLCLGIKVTPGGSITFEGVGAHDDMVMSLALACFKARSFSNNTDMFYVARSSGQIKSLTRDEHPVLISRT